MRLEGIHHITAITGDAQRNLDFYVGALGLRFVKRTVNHDQPDIYHLYYADDEGTPGAVMTFFEYRNAHPGQAGSGMVHTLQWRVANEAALDFWEARLAHAGREVERGANSLRSSDPEGLGIELLVADVADSPLLAEVAEIPREFALQGFHGARAYSHDQEQSAPMLHALGFTQDKTTFEAVGNNRRGLLTYDKAPMERGITSAGTVHHIAWGVTPGDHVAARDAAISGGASPTAIIDRVYFKSIYFREPSGVLFEIATLGPGFTVDEPLEHLGEKLVLPPKLEPMRDELERHLVALHTSDE